MTISNRCPDCAPHVGKHCPTGHHLRSRILAALARARFARQGSDPAWLEYAAAVEAYRMHVEPERVAAELARAEHTPTRRPS